MKILIACEESQRVCKAFRDKGHEAYSCDILATSGDNPEWHIQDDAIKVLLREHWDMLIAFPPCTYLSRAGANRLFKIPGKPDPKRLQLGFEARVFFDRLWTAPIAKVCIENPTPLRIFKLPSPSQVIQPYHFGHPFSKRTLLWTRGLSPLQPTNVVPCEGSWTLLHRSKTKRSKTFLGIAQAMADQWG
jgi:hypothetical protein